MPDLRQGCTTGKPAEDTAPADALILSHGRLKLTKKSFPLFITWFDVVIWMYP
jgi:hypothetical protein